MRETFFFLRELNLNWYPQIVSIKNRILFIGRQYDNKQSPDLPYQLEMFFRTQFPCQWPINMIKVLWCRFQQCLGTFTILLVEASSETGLFRHLSDYVFGVRKIFSFWDNCIWIGIVKLSLLRTGYFSSVANVLTSSPKIWHVNKRDFLQLNCLSSDQWILYRWCDSDLNSAWAPLPCCLSKGSLKWDFLVIHLTTFSESIISKTQNLWESYFHSKCLKFNAIFKNAAKHWEKAFCFGENCIWTGIVKLSLLRTR